MRDRDEARLQGRQRRPQQPAPPRRAAAAAPQALRGGALLALALTACALPGPPRPRVDTSTLVCPAVTLAGLDADGLRIDLHVPRETAYLGAELVLWRALGPDGLAEPFQVIALDETLGATVAAELPLAFLDAGLPPERPLEVLYALEAPADPACALEPLALRLPALPDAPAAPRVDVLGLAVRVTPPPGLDGSARLYRRSIHRQAREPELLVAQWDPSEPFVDTDLEPGGIYAYSLEATAALRAEPGAVTLWLAGPRGPEAYAPVRPPDQLIDVSLPEP